MAQTTLQNIAETTGFYDGIETPLISEPVTTILLSGLTIEKTADKDVWATGELTYTVTINNEEALPYTNVVFNDILDPEIISLVSDSVQVNGETTAYNYDNGTGLLSITLSQSIETEPIIITFRVIKKQP